MRKLRDWLNDDHDHGTERSGELFDIAVQEQNAELVEVLRFYHDLCSLIARAPEPGDNSHRTDFNLRAVADDVWEDVLQLAGANDD